MIEMRKTRRRQHKKQKTKRRGGAGNNNRSTASTNNVPTVMVRNLAGQLYSVQGQTVGNLRKEMAREVGAHPAQVRLINMSSMNHPAALASFSSNGEEKDQMNSIHLSNEQPVINGQMYTIVVDDFDRFTEDQMEELREGIHGMINERSLSYRMRAEKRVEKLLEQGTLVDVSPLCDLIEGTHSIYDQNELEEIYYPLIHLFLNRRAMNKDRWDINEPSDQGECVLHLLVTLPVSGFVETALALGANPTLVNGHGETPEDLAEKANQMDNLALIHEAIKKKGKKKNGKNNA